MYRGGLGGAALGEARMGLTVRKGFMRPELLRRELTGAASGAGDSVSRNLCLRKWSFCSFSPCPGSQTWKQFFLRQTKLEHRMARVKPEDFIFREASGNLGTGIGSAKGTGQYGFKKHTVSFPRVFIQ